jgi:hypothetical protein
MLAAEDARAALGSKDRAASFQKQSLAAKRKVCVLMPLKILFDQRFNKSVT